MLELAIIGAAAVGFAASEYSSRLNKAIVAASQDLALKKPKQALNRIRRATWLPSAGWEVNSFALILNLKAFAHFQLRETEKATKLCAQVMELEKVSSPIRGLIFYRKAELEKGTETAAYIGQAEELWSAGKDELERLKRWKVFAYFNYATGLFDKAAYCFERSLKTEWTPRALFYRAFAYSYGSASPAVCLEKALEALKYSSYPEWDVQLLPLIFGYQTDLEDFETAHETGQQFLRALQKVSPSAALLKAEITVRYLSIRGLRALKRYPEAKEALETWLDMTQGHLALRMGMLHDDGEYELLHSEISKHPPEREPEYFYIHGVANYCVGELHKAVVQLTAALDTNLGKGAGPSAACFLVLTHLALLDLESAEKCLKLVPEREKDWVLDVETNLTYFWKGDPKRGAALSKLQETNQTPLLYHGGFERFHQEGSEQTERSYRHCCRGFRQARVLFHKATALHWSEHWKEAKSLYRQAYALFTGSPMDRARCEIYGLECAAYLGKATPDDLTEILSRLSDRFPHAPSFLLEVQCVRADVLLAFKDYRGVVSTVSSYVEKQPRKFLVATNLNKRAHAYRALGKLAEAKADFQTVLKLAPESFPAREATEALSHF